MKRAASSVLICLLAVSAAGAAAVDDLAGTWTGTTWVPDQGEDALTLVLTKTESSYSGTLTDSFGMADKAELRDVKLENGELTFFFFLVDGSPIRIALKPEGDAMTGYWVNDEGDTGEIKLERQKPPRGR